MAVKGKAEHPLPLTLSESFAHYLLFVEHTLYFAEDKVKIVTHSFFTVSVYQLHQVLPFVLQEKSSSCQGSKSCIFPSWKDGKWRTGAFILMDMANQQGTFEKSCTLLSNSSNFMKYHSLNCCHYYMLINLIVTWAWNFSKCDRWFKNYNCCNDSGTTIFVLTVGLSQCIGVSGNCLSCTSHYFVLRITSNYCFLSFTIKELIFL